MTIHEELDEQTPTYKPRRYHPCRCPTAKGWAVAGCPCRDDDGTASHGGTEVERAQIWGNGFPRQVGG